MCFSSPSSLSQVSPSVYLADLAHTSSSVFTSLPSVAQPGCGLLPPWEIWPTAQWISTLRTSGESSTMQAALAAPWQSCAPSWSCVALKPSRKSKRPTLMSTGSAGDSRPLPLKVLRRGVVWVEEAQSACVHAYSNATTSTSQPTPEPQNQSEIL